MIIKTDQEALEALDALTRYLKGNNRETIKKPLTTQEICDAISKDFKRRRITHQIAADKIGTTKQTITNQISGKKRFSSDMAKKFSEAFGYSIIWLLYGEGDIFRQEYNHDNEYKYLPNDK